jgi:hypothetical protein
MESSTVSETFDFLYELMWLFVREDFIAIQRNVQYAFMLII